jgi:hypothetical protein
MRKLTIDIVAQESIDKRTVALRYDHPVMSRWFPTTQCWKWRGGDALVVVTGDIGRVECWVALRLGNQLHAVCAGSIAAALAAFGYETKVKEVRP